MLNRNKEKPIEHRDSKKKINNPSNPQKGGTDTMSWQDSLFFPGVIPQIAGGFYLDIRFRNRGSGEPGNRRGTPVCPHCVAYRPAPVAGSGRA